MAQMISASVLRDMDAHRICVIKPSALGDIVQSLPLLTSLNERWPDARTAWVANREYVEMLEGHPLLDEVLPFGRRDTWNRIRSWGRFAGLLRMLKQRRFDLVLDLQGLLRTAVLSLATRSPVRVGLETAREGSHWACHHTIPNTGRVVPAYERYRRVAEALGASSFPERVEFPVGTDAHAWASEQLAGPPRPWMAIHPGGRWSSKRWPAEKFASVAAKAMRRMDFAVVLVGSRADQRTANSLAALLTKFVPGGPVLNLTGETTLKQLVAVLKAIDILISNDSGPMHLAAALGTPTLGVFTCTSPLYSGPPGPMHELISTNVPCAGSYRKRCPHRGQQHLACMEELSTERVYQALVRLVERAGLIRHAA